MSAQRSAWRWRSRCLCVGMPVTVCSRLPLLLVCCSEREKLALMMGLSFLVVFFFSK
jgi:hypothetical protein